jgi:hypothetical protein
MKRGAWHQCGDKSQRLVQEELDNGIGSGVIISPRDLKLEGAKTYAEGYRDKGAEVVLDPQFHIPEYTNPQLATYGFSEYRAGISQLNQIGDSDLAALSQTLEVTNRTLGSSAVIAPAVIYEAARGDIVQLNARLFFAAKQAGEALGIPTYATVVIGNSVGASMQTLMPVLSQATALPSDGWYFAFEFEAERIPSDQAAIERTGKAILTLSTTGLPVLHAYAGPLSLLSPGFGATAAGIGHSQNTWRFSPERWQPPSGQGGGGDAPARFFSNTLWGTLIYPDETARLSGSLSNRILTHSPFSTEVRQSPPQPWARWAANKHLVYLIAETVTQVAQRGSARNCARAARDILQGAIALHGDIATAGLQLADGTNRYQANWLAAIDAVLENARNDYDYLELITL